MTLLGMIAVVMSAAQSWQKFVPPKATTVPAIFVSRSSHEVPGYELKLGALNVGWMVVLAAVVCGALILFTPSASEKRNYLWLQTALSAFVLGLACYHFGPFSGIYLAIGGSIFMLIGGVLRYR
jgi:hypothetical protein